MTDHESREALRCEKCGGTDVYTRYRAAGETLDDGFGTARSYFDKIKEECLRRVCRTCGWKWVDPIVAPVVGERKAEPAGWLREFRPDGWSNWMPNGLYLVPPPAPVSPDVRDVPLYRAARTPEEGAA